MSNDRTTVGVVGLGYWGPNLARNFAGLPDAELSWLCDGRPEVLERFAVTYPQARTTGDLDDLLSDPSLDAIVLATPVPSHAELAVRVLEVGKHCFVEKPLAQSVADAERAVDAARRAERILMVGHLLQFHPGLSRLKALVDGGELGDVRYIYGNRLNLGKLRADENALWSLGAHDVSVLLHLAGEEPFELSARGESYMNPGVEDVVFAFMRFPSGLAAHLHLSWLDPHKERRFTVVGSTRMATFDDMAVEGKLTVYDKGFDEKVDTYGEYITRSGDIWSPVIPNAEPLRLECQHFLESIREGRAPLTDGESGLRVVRVLEGLQNDLEASRRAARVEA
jgi:predicted dehydrogenase